MGKYRGAPMNSETEEKCPTVELVDDVLPIRKGTATLRYLYRIHVRKVPVERKVPYELCPSGNLYIDLNPEWQMGIWMCSGVTAEDVSPRLLALTAAAEELGYMSGKCLSEVGFEFCRKSA